MALRELGIIVTVAILCVWGLFKPKVALFGYIWFAIVQPDVAAWIEGKYPFSLALASCTLLGGVRYMPRLPAILSSPAVTAFLLLQIPIAASAIFSVGPFLSGDRYFRFEQLALMVMMFPILLETRRDMKQLIAVLAVSEAMLGGRFGLYGMVQGGVILNQSYGHLYDNNELALAVVMLIPMCWYARQLTSSTVLKLGLFGVVLASVAGVLMSNSRGSSIAMGVAFLCIVYRSKQKVLTFAVLAIAMAPALYLIGDQYMNRMATIQTYEDDESAANRLDLWKTAIELSVEHPVVGVGFGGRNFAVVGAKHRNSDRPTAVHNSYLSMLVSSGVFALMLYVALIFGSIIWLGRCARRLKPDPDGTYYVAVAMQVSLIAYAVGATFYSHERYDFMYMLLMASAALYVIEANTPSEVREEPAPAVVTDSPWLAARRQALSTYGPRP